MEARWSNLLVQGPDFMVGEFHARVISSRHVLYIGIYLAICTWGASLRFPCSDA